MELEKIKNLVEYYEDKIVVNFEKNFNELVLMDFYEGGYDDRIEDEFFFEEYFSRYERDIVNLLLEIEDSFESEFKGLKLRLIKMKRIIDNHFAKVSYSNNLDNHKNFRTTRKDRFLLYSKVDKENLIKILYSKLVENQLIDITEDLFRKHFENNWKGKIQWLGTELQLSNLIHLLIENKYLDSETKTSKHKLVATHFLNKKGNEFNPKQLGSVLSDKKETIATDDVILKIMDEVKGSMK